MADKQFSEKEIGWLCGLAQETLASEYADNLIRETVGAPKSTWGKFKQKVDQTIIENEKKRDQR